jgi:cytidylate kinase
MASHSIQQLVEIQGRRWERSQPHGVKRFRPCVAISRLPYSGAHDVGARVATRLDYGFFAREIVDEIAKKEGVRRELVAGLDEHVENAIERHVIDGFRHRNFTENDYVRGVSRVVSTLAHRGAAVILGRGAACIVDPTQALRVLVVAPVEWRRARLAEIRKVAAEEAAERLRNEDQERVQFHRRSFHFEQDEPTNYDLVVNTGSLGLGTAASIIVETLHRRFHEA